MMRLNVKTPEVRDIATIISMQSLAHLEGSAVSDSQSFKYPPFDLTGQLCPQWQEKLEAMDEQWDELAETKDIKRQHFGRLGIYYEKLLAVVFRHLLSNLRVIDTNIQLSDGQRTIGELDFLLASESNEIIHLEVAIKFYLCSTLNKNHWYEQKLWLGTNRRDNLQKKMDYMFDVQLDRTSRQEFKDDLKSRNIYPSKKTWLLQGLRFLPLKVDFNFPIREHIGKQHCHAWVQFTMFREMIGLFNEYRFYALKKCDWIGGNIDDSEQTYGDHALDATEIVDYIHTALTAVPEGAPKKKYADSYRSVMLQLVPARESELSNETADLRLLVVEDSWM